MPVGTVPSLPGAVSGSLECLISASTGAQKLKVLLAASMVAITMDSCPIFVTVSHSSAIQMLVEGG